MMKYKKGSAHWMTGHEKPNPFKMAQFMDIGDDLDEGEEASRRYLKKHIK